MTSYFKALPVGTLLLALATQAQPVQAQAEQAAAVATTGAVRPIPTSDQMFKKTLTRAIDLREKQNRPMFSEGKEISRVIIEAVKRGELTPYKNDSTTSTLTAKEMSSNMSYPIQAAPGGDDTDWGGGGTNKPKPAASTSDAWGTPSAASTASSQRVPKRDRNGKIMKDRQGRTIYTTVAATPAAPPPPPPPTTAEYRAKDIYQMEMTEEMIFDKKRSRMYHQIKTISLKLPATLGANASGLEKNIATFKYADVVKVFRDHPQAAIWFNEQNEAQNKNMADAFELWLFNSYIIKVSNPKDNMLSDQYGSERNGLLAAQQTAADLIEYEYNLWSF